MPAVIFKIGDLDVDLLKDILGDVCEEKQVTINGKKEEVIELSNITKKDLYAFMAIIGLYNTRVRML